MTDRSGRDGRSTAGTADTDRSASRAEGERDDRGTVAGSRVVVAFGIALVAVTAAFGAVLGYALPALTGVEEAVLLGVPVPISPVTFALYGTVSVGTVVVTFVLVLRAVARFDENAV